MTTIVVDVPHWPAPGVKVYVVGPVAVVLIAAGFQVPVIPFMDVVGRTGAVAFWHRDPIALKAGATCEVMITDIDAVAPHWPPSGVKVYVVVPAVAVLIVAGFHVPLTPLFDVVGNAGAVLLRQSGSISVKTGITEPVICTDIVIGVPHCPAAGVKVYVAVPAVDVLMVAGLHVPVIPLFDVEGNAGAVLF